VLGIDLEPAMLAIARRKAAEAGLAGRLDLVEGDMRSFSTPEPAALVTIPFRAFLHNLTTDDQLATLRACHDALRPGGRLALNVFNPDLAMITRWMGKGPDHWEPYWPSAGGGDEFQAHQEYAPSSQISTTRVRVRDLDGKWRKTSVTLRYVYRYEMEHLLARCGFQVEALYGGFDRSEFREASPEMVWIARRS
jgi:SAM-dependent methyltransferase